MKALIIYDSVYGNTQQVAESIAAALGSADEVALKRPAEFDLADLNGLDLLLVGAPTQRLTYTPAVGALLKRIPRSALQGLKVTAFDTRLTWENINATPVLPFFVRIFGFAAEPLAKQLKRRGGQLITPPQGFLVEGMEGPLVPGELERAAAWGRQIAAALGG